MIASLESGGLGLLVLLPLASCAFTKEEPLKLEACRKTVDGREEIVYVIVEPRKLAEAGVTEEEPKAFVKDLFQGMDQLMAEAVSEVVNGPAAKARVVEKPQPAWLRHVFRDGIPLEIIVTEKDGTRMTRRHKLSPSSSR